MYAIVKTGGKQYRVEQGQSLLVERLPVSDGDSVALTPLLFVDGSSVVDDADGLAGVTVAARVVGHERGPKLRIVKFKPKRGYKRRTGHRQDLTRIEVTEITAGGGKAAGKRSRKAAARKEEAPAPEAAPTPAPAAPAETAPEAAPTPAATAAAEAAPEQAPEAAQTPDEAPVTPATTTPQEETDGA